MIRTSVIPNKLKEELEDVGKVYNNRSGICVYPNAFSRLQTEIVKVCNEKEIAEKHILELLKDKGELTDKVKELKDKCSDLLDKLYLSGLSAKQIALVEKMQDVLGV